MKIKSGIVIQKVGSSYVAVADRGEGNGKMLKLNESGAFLLNRAIELGLDSSALAAELVAEYSISTEIAERDAARFVALAVESGICENE